MSSSPPLRLAVVLLLVGSAAPVWGQSFSDAGAFGVLRDQRKKASPIIIGPHAFQPRIITKLFDVTTPHAFGAIGVGYTDNLLLGDPDAVGVDIEREVFGVFQAGARLDTQIRDHRIELGYRSRFTEHSGSGGYDRLEHRADLRIDLIGIDLEGHVDGGWRRSAFPRNIQLQGVVWTETFTSSLWGEVRFGKLGIRAGGHASNNRYLESDLRYFSHDRFGADLQVHYLLFAKVRAILEYNWSRIDYRQQVLTSYQVHTLRAGLDGELSPKLTGSIKLGVSQQLLDSKTIQGDRSYEGFTAECALSWKPLEGSTLRLTYVRSVQPSVRSNYLISDEVALVASQRLLQDSLTVSARVAYEHAVISPGAHLNKFTAGAQVRYRITEWMSVSVQYGYRNLRSGIPDSNQFEHFVFASLGVGL